MKFLKILLCAALISQLFPTPIMASENVVKTVTLTRYNTIIFASEIVTPSVDLFLNAVLGKRMMLDPKETLYIVISSPGGIYIDSLKMAMILQRVENVKLICLMCASAAGMVFITSSLPRLITDRSVVLMHEMYNEHVTAKDLREPGYIKDLLESSDTFNKLIYTVLRISKEKYESLIEGRNWILRGQDIIKYHAADRMVNIKCDPYIDTVIPSACEVE